MSQEKNISVGVIVRDITYKLETTYNEITHDENCDFCGIIFRGNDITSQRLSYQNKKYNPGRHALCATCLWNKMRLDGAKYP